MATTRPFLMFMGDAKPAIDAYLAAFGEQGSTKLLQQRDDGTVERATLELGGLELMLFDAPNPDDHAFTFTPATSLFVTCASEDEQQRLWDALSEGGGVLMPLADYGFSQRFGWLADRFGVSWQLDLPN
jgi:predicted 3-demethylubiquinone-9 3-methyltransferase (glyoxalase superfamily)